MGQLRRQKAAAKVVKFCRHVIQETVDSACCFKPNIAFFEVLGPEGLTALLEVLKNIPCDVPVLLDCKRGDIGSTAAAYAFSSFEVYGADAVTVNPYMGSDCLAPFLSNKKKGVFVLCRTSNPSADEIQGLRIRDDSDDGEYDEEVENNNSNNSNEKNNEDSSVIYNKKCNTDKDDEHGSGGGDDDFRRGKAKEQQTTMTTTMANAKKKSAGKREELFLRVARWASRLSSGDEKSWLEEGGGIGLVVGATNENALAEVRKAAPSLWILAPGVGTQGGDLEAAVLNGLRSDGLGLLLPISRGITSSKDIRATAESFRRQINAAREKQQKRQQK